MKTTKKMDRPTIGVIGGSGLYEMEGLARVKQVRVTTPFGPPSDAFVVGDLEGARVAFLARHGRGHRISPSEINYRANIYTMKKLGVERVLSVSAVGSMKEALHPGHVVIPNQFFDWPFQYVQPFPLARLRKVGKAYPEPSECHNQPSPEPIPSKCL